MEETKPPESQDNADIDVDVDYSDEKDEDYKAIGINDN